MCGQCYERANDSSKVNDWFTEICDPPHLLVWAKLTGHPYWPAKVIGITTTSNHLDVRFFGDHDMAKVSPQDCFLYPSKNPNKPLEASVEEQVKASVAVRVFILCLAFLSNSESLNFSYFLLVPKTGSGKIFGTNWSKIWMCRSNASTPYIVSGARHWPTSPENDTEASASG